MSKLPTLSFQRGYMHLIVRRWCILSWRWQRLRRPTAYSNCFLGFRLSLWRSDDVPSHAIAFMLHKMGVLK